MAIAVDTSSEVQHLTREEGIELFDRVARHELGISGPEFVRRYLAGELAELDDANHDGVTELIVMLPFAGVSPRDVTAD